MTTLTARKATSTYYSPDYGTGCHKSLLCFIHHLSAKSPPVSRLKMSGCSRKRHCAPVGNFCNVLPAFAHTTRTQHYAALRVRHTQCSKLMRHLSDLSMIPLHVCNTSSGDSGIAPPRQKPRANAKHSFPPESGLLPRERTCSSCIL